MAKKTPKKQSIISKDDLLSIAHLSRIHLHDKEVERLTKTLEDILCYIEKLKKLNVANVQPTSHVLPLRNVYRTDSVRPSLKQYDVMNMVAHKEKGAFKVPKVIE